MGLSVFRSSGPPHSLKYSQVRKTSLVLQWKPPIHSGRTPVTGYFVDIKEASAREDRWRGLNEAALKHTYLKVRGCSQFEKVPPPPFFFSFFFKEKGFF